MQFGIFTVSDITPDPTTGRAPTEADRIKAVLAIARKAESCGTPWPPGSWTGRTSAGPTSERNVPLTLDTM